MTGWRVATALASLLVLLWAAAAQSADVRNVQLAEEDGRVVVTYDLTGEGPARVSLVGSEDGGASFTLRVASVTGDVGAGLAPGPGKRIVWNVERDHPGGLDDRDVVLEVRAENMEPGSGGMPRRPAGPTYFVIPVHGEVGREVLAEVLSRCLEQAERHEADVVVLEVDSPGGSLQELYRLLNVSIRWQERHPQQRVVGLVRARAMSAAAVFATTCKELYMFSGSALGAAMAIRTDGRRISGVAEKFSSAYRGRARAAAEAGGHEPLLVEAMIDPDVALYLARPPDGPVALSRDPGAGAVLVERGKLLTLTAAEAVDVGLAAAVVADYAELGRGLGFAAWTEYGDAGRRIAAERAAEVSRVEQDYADLVATIEDGLSRLRQSSGSQLSAIESNIWAVRAAVDELDEMVEHYPFMAVKVRATFTESTREIKRKCDEAIGNIKRYRARRR